MIREATATTRTELDALEARVEDLLRELARLRHDNAALRTDLATIEASTRSARARVVDMVERLKLLEHAS